MRRTQPNLQRPLHGRACRLLHATAASAIRAANRAAWSEPWKARITLPGADQRWQAPTDAALFYLFSPTHVASPASTSIFGLATLHDYHYYYGHVMWDIETFVVSVLSLLQPHAAESVLEYRIRSLPSAMSNARLRGRRGVQFQWGARHRDRKPLHYRALHRGMRITCPLMLLAPLRSILT